MLMAIISDAKIKVHVYLMSNECCLNSTLKRLRILYLNIKICHIYDFLGIVQKSINT